MGKRAVHGKRGRAKRKVQAGGSRRKAQAGGNSSSEYQRVNDCAPASSSNTNSSVTVTCTFFGDLNFPAPYVSYSI